MSNNDVRLQSLVSQVDDATARFLMNELKLVKLASNKDKSLATVAAETTEIESSTSGIVRAVEDLLVISRRLKEAWVLGQRKPNEAVNSDDLERSRQTTQDIISQLSSINEWL
ncbi:hypothetical protein DASB73_027660 [Starmerella bacillaris]|uniref:Mediator of RNA polymerase II transcription subunit 22 n=1 Tax=Starmerella bacillaris TaxID=1247836 RepID=A0AAV5RKU6_STABA|nr:hypothetical protein DASB73_027660 [Starmerella bacillaris]